MMVMVVNHLLPGTSSSASSCLIHTCCLQLTQTRLYHFKRQTAAHLLLLLLLLLPLLTVVADVLLIILSSHCHCRVAVDWWTVAVKCVCLAEHSDLTTYLLLVDQ